MSNLYFAAYLLMAVLASVVVVGIIHATLADRRTQREDARRQAAQRSQLRSREWRGGVR